MNRFIKSISLGTLSALLLVSNAYAEGGGLADRMAESQAYLLTDQERMEQILETSAPSAAGSEMQADSNLMMEESLSAHERKRRDVGNDR